MNLRQRTLVVALVLALTAGVRSAHATDFQCVLWVVAFSDPKDKIDIYQQTGSRLHFDFLITPFASPPESIEVEQRGRITLRAADLYDIAGVASSEIPNTSVRFEAVNPFHVTVRPQGGGAYVPQCFMQ